MNTADRSDTPDIPRWTSRTVSSGDAHIAAQAAGGDTGPAILLMGGATWSRDWWSDSFCAALVDAGLRPIRYDQRDTGESTLYPPGAPEYSGSDLVSDAVAVLDAFDVAEAVVLGLSWGGGLAQRLTHQHPDRVAGLVLVSTSPLPSTDRGVPELPGPTPEIMQTFSDPPADLDWMDRDEVIEWVLEGERPYAGPSRFDADALRTLIGGIWDRTPSMASAGNHFAVADGGGDRDDRISYDIVTDRPTLVAHGSADPMFPLPHGEALAEVLGARLLVLDGVGHQAPPPDTWDELVNGIAGIASLTGNRGTR